MKEQILELHKQGKSYREIQKELKCSKGTIAYHLGIGQKDKSMARQRDKRNAVRKFIQTFKTSKPCADCGETYPYWIMEFDHLKNKKFTLGRFSAYSSDIDTIKKEIKKCEVVCANCHRNRTFQRLVKSAGDVHLSLSAILKK